MIIEPEAVRILPVADRRLFFSMMASVSAKPRTTSKLWPEIVAMMREPDEHATKAACPLLKLSTFRGSRTNESADELHGVEGDHDAGTMQPQEAAERLKAADIGAVVYTTPSHTAEKPRWRVLAPLSRAYLPTERAGFVDTLDSVLGGALAVESWTISQPFYFGRVTGVEYACIEVAGQYLDQIEAIESAGKPGAAKKPRKPAAIADDLTRMSTIASVTDDTMVDIETVLFDKRFDRVSRHVWMKVCYALKATGHPRAIDIFMAWTTPGGRDDPEETWNGVDPTKATHATIFMLAKEFGIPNPKSKGAGKAAPAIVPRNCPRFWPYSHREMKSRPPMRWLIQDTQPEGITMIYGPPASGKSFAVMDLGLAISRGVDWRGLRTTPGVVVYLASEGQAGVAKRVDAYLVHNGIEDPGQFYYVTDAPNLGALDDVEPLANAIEFTTGCDLIIVDTLAASSAGADENSAKDMGLVIDHCKWLAKRLGCTVLVVHHTGKDQTRGARGSNAWLAAVDAEISVTKGDVTNTGALSNPKMKDGAEFAPLGFQLDVVTVGVDEHGLPITSCVVIWTGKPTAKAAVKLGKNEQVVLDVIVWRIEDFGHAVEKEVIAFAVDRLVREDGKRDKRPYSVASAIQGLRRKGFIKQGDQEFFIPP